MMINPKMKFTQIGTTGILMTTTVSFAQFLETIGLSRITTTLAYKAVRGYQRYISPYKGFRCAHYQLHRETSCSGHFRDLLAQHGLSQTLQLFPRRLAECQDAYFVLKMHANSTPTDGESATEESEDGQPTKQEDNSDNDASEAVDCACCAGLTCFDLIC
jgi:putative component of membrane protein insertase Oxa1/YidC/SpoIIIJ protein YidD